MAATPYKKFPGRGRGLMNAATLWDGGDHLLMVEAHLVSESYRRFYYKDIQAIVICQTQTGFITGIVTAMLGLIMGASAFFTPTVLSYLLGTIAVLFLIIGGLILVQGPTCRCMLRTAVQTQELTSLSHVRKALKVLRQLQPKIEAAQEEPATR